jgi:two-component system response regulator AtoC
LLLTCIQQRIPLLQKKARLDNKIKQIHEDRTIVAASEAMIETLELLERAAGSDVPALLIGEVGTRKPLMAQTIHTQSSRRGGPFIEAKCGQFKESEINQKLFGAPAGASQGWRGSNCGLIALADRGTLFLGQVEKLPIELQRGLLHVIEERELWNDQESLPRHVDVRVIAASSEDLATAVSQGRFDPKLYERLRMMTIPLPSLKDRRKDIPLLVDQFLAHFQRGLGKNIGPLSSEALERLCDYSWPGNVRELQNAIERAIILAQDGGITLAHLPRGIVEEYRTPASDCGENFALKPARITFETQLIVRALQATDGNRTRAAALLGISHRSLLYKLKAYSIRD